MYRDSLPVMPSPRVTSQITLYGQFAGANTNLIIGNGTCYAAHVRIGASTETEDAYQKLIWERLHKYSVGWWWKENGREGGISSLPRDVSSFLVFLRKGKRERERKEGKIG